MFAHWRHAALFPAACLLAATALPAPAASPTQPMVQRSYAVADLVVPLERALANPPKALGTMEKTAKPQPTLETRLIHLIHKSVGPTSWADHGGAGSIDYYPLGMTLVVTQTAAAHAQIADLLAQLRRQLNTEVALEVRLLTVSEDFQERFGVDFSMQFHASGAGSAKQPAAAPSSMKVGGDVQALDLGTKFLSDAQVRRLLEAVQGDRRANIMQAPKLTMFNGQVGRIEATDTQFFTTAVDVVRAGEQTVVRPKNEPTRLGFQMTAQPVVSADRRFVQVYLKVDQTNLASPAVPLVPVEVPVKDGLGQTGPFKFFLQQPRLTRLAVEKTVAIPDGGTVVFGGFKKVSEVRQEYGPPVLSDIPFLNRLFKNIGYARESELVLVLVTPRIIVSEPEEVKAVSAACTRCAEPARPACSAGGTTWPDDGFAREMTAKLGEVCAPPQKSAEAPIPVCGRKGKVLTELLTAYDDACARGLKAEAAKYAQAAITLDATCFQKQR